MGIIPQPLTIWNQFDEYGLLAGLGHWSPDSNTLEYVRYPGENNKQLKNRILTANKYRGNATIQGMINNISRDLSISISGDYTLPIYNNITKKYFYLSETPYPSVSGVRVWVSPSGTWSSGNELTLQVRASGYSTSSSGWIVWNTPDWNPSLIPSGMPGSSGWYNDRGIIEQYVSDIQPGNYTQILEFIGSSVPNTGDSIKVEYLISNGVDDYGQVVLNWRADFSNPDNPYDLSFKGLKSEYPATGLNYRSFSSGHVSIFQLFELQSPVISSFFYDPSGRATQTFINLATMVNNDYPLYWNQFRYDTARWDALDYSASGSIPSFHNEPISSLAPVSIKGGSKYGVDLDCIGVSVVGSGSARDPWYPIFVPGEFYIGNERFYLFGKQNYQTINLVSVGGGILSGNLSGSLSTWPYRLGMIMGYSSGVFYNDTNLPNNPYIKRIHDYSNVISGVYYRSPYIAYSSGFVPSAQNFNSNTFYYDYTLGSIYASGVDPSGFVLAWEDPGVYISGIVAVYSGWTGLTTIDLNPLTNPFDKVLYLK